MRHRGPDCEDSIKIENWTLGHQRLSIIDTSLAGNQPMSKDGNILILNGEIYNYIELKKEFLKGTRFFSDSDTEVLLELLNRFGLKILNHVNGMFAFAWYNSRENKLILCRDRFGVKPLHWMKINDFIFFSSEIKPLIQIKPTFEFNENIIQSFILDTATDFDVQTFAEDIFQLTPGHFISIDQSGSHLDSKWYFGNDFDTVNINDKQELVSYFEFLLTDAIKLRHRSDVPICITLSGGLDSSTIYTLAKERLNSDLQAFTFSHPNAPTDEAKAVMELTAKYGDKPIIIESDENQSWRELKEALFYLEFPIWNSSAVAYLNTYKAIKSHGFKVIIEGHGGDEILGGYPYMIEAAWEELLYKCCFLDSFKVLKVFKETLNLSLNQQYNDDINIKQYLKKYMYKNLKHTLGNILLSRPPQIPNGYFQSILEKSFNFKILPIVLRTFDRLTMSQSVESRSPFMDYRIVEFSRNIPLKFKVNSLGSKAILREILKKYGQNDIYKNKVKMGFASDVPKLYNEPKNKLYIEHYLNSFDFPGHNGLKYSAIAMNSKSDIQWSDVELIWKTIALSMTKEFYKKSN